MESVRITRLDCTLQQHVERNELTVSCNASGQVVLPPDIRDFHETALVLGKGVTVEPTSIGPKVTRLCMAEPLLVDLEGVNLKSFFTFMDETPRPHLKCLESVTELTIAFGSSTKTNALAEQCWTSLETCTLMAMEHQVDVFPRVIQTIKFGRPECVMVLSPMPDYFFTKERLERNPRVKSIVQKEGKMHLTLSKEANIVYVASYDKFNHFTRSCLADRFKGNNICVMLPPETMTKFSEQMEDCEKQGVRWMVIIDRGYETLRVKDVRDRTDLGYDIALNDIVGHVRALFAL